MQIRPATIADAPTIARFNILLARESENISLDADVIDAGVGAILSDQTKGLYFVATVDDRIVGQIMITYEWSDWRNGDIWWIQSVYVDANHRRQGVLRELYRFVRERAIESGAVALRLYVHGENAGAQKCYRALGMSTSEYKILEDLFSAASEGT